MNDVERVDQYVDMVVAMAFNFGPKLLLISVASMVGIATTSFLY